MGFNIEERVAFSFPLASFTHWIMEKKK